ncbi:heparin/heparin-sulfate lyase HepB [Cohnella sp. JJ-181]|uniref:heparin/heparin-sulfate lyase HepB n=1 Tax=Cohnella rhizoplanae TaxID=2974897 RepID=UPI0022FF6AD2|nr:heparin/heparin-sulfate lyase HepB [Cohnella sp. JJ-181]CAI6048954.1 hypothetical protein COHCIP112018_01396 [Cohnella sp. JJ-181]
MTITINALLKRLLIGIVAAASIAFVAPGDGLAADPSETIYTNPYTPPPITPPAGVHPRLFVRSGDLAEISSNLHRGELASPADVWNRIVNTAANTAANNGSLAVPPAGGTNYNDTILTIIKDNAMLYLVDGNLAAGQKAVTYMNNYMNTFVPANQDSRNIGNVILTAAIVYDWCYNHSALTSAIKLDWRKRVVSFAASMEIGYPPTGESSLTSHGSEAELLRDMLSFAVAAYDENTNIYDIAAGRFFQEYIPARNYMYAAEYQPQGDSYGMYRFSWDMYAAWLFKRMGAGDVFNAQQAKMPYQYLYMRRPDGQLTRDGDNFVATSPNYPYGTYWSDDIPALFLTAHYYRDPILKGEFLEEYTPGHGNYQIEDIFRVLFADPDLTAATKGVLPLTKRFGGGVGEMIARTGWDADAPDGVNMASDTVVAEMRIGGMYFANHQHLDAGSFEIYYKGGLAIDSGIYQSTGTSANTTYFTAHDKNYHKRTIAHNSMLVYDPGEPTVSGFVNDGGQRLPNNLLEPKSLNELLNPAKRYEVASVLQSAIGPNAIEPDYSYIKGDITKAYSSKVSDYKRSMVFLNNKNTTYPALMFVYDKLTASNASFKKTWLLHSQTDPSISGNSATITRTDHGYNGKLVNTTLLPASASITKIGGSGFEHYVNGTNYLALPTVNSTTEGGQYRVEVSPSSATNNTDYFLNVVQVMGASTEPVTATYITDNAVLSAAKMVGGKVRDKVVLFGKDGDEVNSSFTFTAPGTESTINYLLTDLAPGTWTVTPYGGTSTDYEVAASEGALYFSGAAGTYTITPSALTVSSDATLSALKVDGVTVPSFASGTLTYNLTRSSGLTLPAVSATANEAHATVSVTQAGAVPGSATVVVTAQDGTTINTYTVNFLPAPVVTYTIVASEDSYVDSAHPTINYDSAANTFLQVARDTKETWLKFDITGIYGTVTAATLNVTAQSLSVPIQMYAYSTANDSWTESGITWNNKPTSGRTLQSPTAILSTTMAPKSYNVTNLVQNTTDGKITLIMICNLASGAQMFSKDAATGKPYLQITTS